MSDDKRERDRLAMEATRLLNEPLLVDALDTLLADAFAEIKDVHISAETLSDVIALQQRINVIQEIPELLKAKILASGQSDGGMAAENEPTG